MHRPLRWLVLSAALTALPAWAQTQIGWTGNGIAPRWSDPLNWGAMRPPIDGESAVFSGSPSFADNAVDLSVALHSLVFAANASTFVIRVAGDAANVLSFTGLGVQNFTSGSGPFRQSLYAAAGAFGGTVVFANSAGLNLGAPESYRAIDIVAQGASIYGAAGGHVVFQDNASTGTTTFNSLRAEGASVAGASGGDVVFRGNAVATVFTTVAVGGGSAAGALGGRASFADGVRMDGNLAVLAGEAGGLGGRATFAGHAVAGFTSSIQTFGGNSIGGSAGGTQFSGDAVLAGSVTNGAGNATGAGGGQLEFRDRASFDSTGSNPDLGQIVIRNGGGSVELAGGGRTVFADDSFVRGSNVVIFNSTNAESDVSIGGSTEFRDRSRAGQATIVNEGGVAATIVGGPATQSGLTIFRDAASAENALLQQNGGNTLFAAGGSVQFLGNATAAAARIDSHGGAVAGAFGGTASFAGTASAGSATIVNGAGQGSAALGGQALFSGNSGAGTATISNQAALFAGGAGGGYTHFTDSASAQGARIDNLGATEIAGRALTLFSNNATAGNAQIVNLGARGGGPDLLGGGATIFENTSSAGAASILNAGGGVSGARGGTLEFFDSATAASANVSLLGGSVAGALGGSTSFRAGTTAAQASFAVGAGSVDGAQGATLRFDGFGATAAESRIVNQAGAAAAGGGQTIFGGSASGAQGGTATIVNQGGAGSYGRTSFMDRTSAFNASIVNEGGSSAGNGGWTSFQGFSSAGRATITNLAGSAFGDGHTTFGGTSDASASTIVVQGSTAATVGSGRAAYVVFTDGSTAGASTLIAQGATAAGPGSAGGVIQFDTNARGGSARFVVEASGVGGGAGVLDVGRVNGGAITVGSIEGGGNVFLGANRMYVGANGQQTTFSGAIRDGGLGGGSGGQLWVYGAGSLTLSGASTYSGGTYIGSSVEGGGGKLIVTNTTGSATGSGFVSVESTGTLSGSGVIAGPVFLHAGGTIAPGDPVTLTIKDSLTWDGGGVIRLVLGADSTGSDHLSVGSLIRGRDGIYLFDLVDWGISAGTEYDLLSFDELVGFDADDFSVRGVDGIFSLEGGRLGFTAGSVAAVPEPETYAMFAAGLLLMTAVARRRRRAAR